MSDWEVALSGLRDNFIEELRRSGFSLQEDGGLIGTVPVPHEGGERAHTVEVTVPHGFPFVPPRVRPLDGYGTRSWHQDPDGALCLYAREEGEDLPWRDPSSVIDRVREWFVHDERGWPDDAPDLDLERYFDRAAGLLLVHDLHALVGKPLRARWMGNDVMQVVGTGTRPNGGRRGDLYGWAVDVGEPERPPRTWDELKELLPTQAAHVIKGVERSGRAFLVVRYMRKGYAGALGLITARGDAGIQLTSIETAEDASSVLRLRGGEDQGLLGARSVAIVGVGAIGSFTADALARRGVGRMLLQDGERLRPGNCIRHLAGIDSVGLFKGEAVRNVLLATGRASAGDIVCVDADVARPSQARELLATHDLVIDTTAHGTTSAMLASAASAIHRPLISACLLGDGSVARIDRWPLVDGEAHDPAMDHEPPARRPLREGGCGDPVSPASPIAVLEAATLTAEFAIRLLTGGRPNATVTRQVADPLR